RQTAARGIQELRETHGCRRGPVAGVDADPDGPLRYQHRAGSPRPLRDGPNEAPSAGGGAGRKGRCEARVSVSPLSLPSVVRRLLRTSGGRDLSRILRGRLTAHLNEEHMNTSTVVSVVMLVVFVAMYVARRRSRLVSEDQD